MRSESLTAKKGRKGFYSAGFRYIVNILIISVILNLFLTGAIHSRLARMPQPDFYATDGIATPTLLSPLSEPNLTAAPLLPDDPPEEMTIRELPEYV